MGFTVFINLMTKILGQEKVVKKWPQNASVFLSSKIRISQDYLSHIVRKPVYAICEQQRRRSACAAAQSDQHLCCSLLR